MIAGKEIVSGGFEKYVAWLDHNSADDKSAKATGHASLETLDTELVDSRLLHT